MIDFNVVPSTPVVDTPTADGATEGGDAHVEGAFAEMLSRSLGRELVGRYTQWGHDRDGEQGAAGDHPADQGGETLPVGGASVVSVAAAPAVEVAETGAPPPADPQLWGVAPVTRSANPAAAAPKPAAPVAAEPMPVPRAAAPMDTATDGTVAREVAGPDRAGVTTPVRRPGTQPPVRVDESPLRRRVVPDGGAQPRDSAAPQRWDPAAVRALRPDLMTPSSQPSPPDTELPATQRSSVVAGRAAAIAERSRGADLDAVRALEAIDAVDRGPSSVAVAAGARSAAVVSMGTPALQPVATGIVERIVQVVEMQRNQPPPRAIAVDLPEFDGLRLVVSMRGDGSVHVAPSGALPSHSAVSPLLSAVGEALVENGFQLADDGDSGRRSPQQEEESAPRPRSTPPRRTIGARRAGLRI